ncbi:MAG: PAS domain S-box protein [Desulfobacteraceae bacterium]|nr:MAG: PAS domain S-box protein [Desulfobacteraceae bacterium]
MIKTWTGLTKIRTKITLLALILITASSAIVMAVFLTGISDYRNELEKELEKQIHDEVGPLAHAMYRLCEAMHKASVTQRKHTLTIMRQLMEKQGVAHLGTETDRLTTMDPQGNAGEIQVPRLFLGGKPLKLNAEPHIATPVVDEMMNLTGYHSSIMLRTSQEGDFVRVATSVIRDGRRQIGFMLPAREADGSPNPFARSVIAGETALGRTYIEDFVFVSTVLPLRDQHDQIIGCYGVGIRQDLMENLRRVFMDTPVGKTGYFFILGAKGKQKGRYILSSKGERDGEDVWNVQSADGTFPVREVFRRAIEQNPGELAWYSYDWQNPGDSQPRKKYAAMIYFKPWDWILGASAYEEDFIETSQRLGSHLETIIFKVTAASMIVLLVSAFFFWLLGRQISKPLNRAVEFADQISQGRFPAPLEITAKDETGHLAKTLNLMAGKLETTLNDLTQAEKDFRTLYESSRDAILIIENNVFIDCNQAAADLFGARSKDEIVGKEPFILSPQNQPGGESSRTLALQRIKESVDRGSNRFEWCHRKIDGTDFYTEVQLSAMEIGGRPIIKTAIRDISLRKKDEEQLIQLRTYLSNIIDSMRSVLVVVDRSCTVTLWNRMAEDATGVPAGDATGRSLYEVLPSLESHKEKIELAITGRVIQKALKAAREVKNGMVYEDIMIYPLVSKGIDGAVIRLDDVSSRVRMEEVMIQSEKMMSVGGLAAGMAHEINNPLAGMIQGAQVVTNRLLGDIPGNRKTAGEVGISFDAIRDYAEKRNIIRQLQSMRSAGSRAARIVENMLSFSRVQPVKEVHNPGNLLDLTLELAQNDYDLKKQFDFKDIRITRDYRADTPPVLCEGNQIQQVFFNILKNGAQAMSEKPVPSPSFILKTWGRGHTVFISIEDNGPGMDEDTRKRVFEPFFTTKSVGVGTGLGLSVSFFIITQNHGGEMTVDSVPGQGCRFIIQLPAAHAPSQT